MKYFEKLATWTEMIEDEQNLTAERFNEPGSALSKVTSVLRDIQASKPLAPGKNPDTTIKNLL